MNKKNNHETNITDDIQTLIDHLRQQQVHFWVENQNIKFRAPEGVMTSEIISKLKAVKSQLVKYFSSSCAQDSLQADEQNRFAPFPLTHVQSAYFIGRQNFLSYGGIGCHGYFEIIAPKWDENLLTEVWNKIIKRHDMLRAIILPNGEQQILATVSYLPVEVSSLEREALRIKMSHRVYQTDQWPLFDLKISHCADGDCLHFSIDLLIADFLSVQILLSELFEGYLQGKSEGKPLGLSFRDVVLYEKQQTNHSTYEVDRHYWLSRLDTLPVAPILPLLRQKNQPSPHFERYEFQLPPSEWQTIQSIAKNEGVSLSTLLLTIFSEVIAYWSESRHFTLNITVMNRPPIHAEIDKLVGDFTSVTLLEINLTRRQPILEHIRQIQAQLWQDLSHQTFSGVELLREWGRKIGKDHALMPVVFTSALVGEGKYQPEGTDHPLKLRFDYGISQTPQVWIDCQVMVIQGKLHLNWDVMQGVFPTDMIKNMFNVFEHTIRTIISTPQLLEQEFSVQLPPQQIQQRQEINQINAVFPPSCLHDIIIKQASCYPNAIAIVDGQTVLTYQQLLEKATSLADKLESQQRYAVLMPRGSEYVISILAILMAGSAFLSIDNQQPSTYILQSLNEAQVNILISATKQPILEQQGMTVLSFGDLIKHSETNKKHSTPTPTPNSLACIVFNDEHKGVMLSHDAIYNTISGIQQRIGILHTDTILALANVDSDRSVFELFGMLNTGGKVVFPDALQSVKPSHWVDLIDKHEVTILNSPPTQMRILLTYLEEKQITLPVLRYILLSGDLVPITLPKAIKQMFPNAQQLTLGGATEAGIWSYYWPINPDTDYPDITHRLPLPNQKIRIVNTQEQDCPNWVTGELWIGGRGIALGYTQNEEATTKFTTDEYGNHWYRTGKLARYNQDSLLEWLEHVEPLVNINGHHIDITEIETHLKQLNEIDRAAVIKVSEDGIDHLHAYISPAFQAANSAAKIQLVEYFHHALSRMKSEAEKIANTLDREKINELCTLLDEVALMHMLGALLQLSALSETTPRSLEHILQLGNIAKDNQQLLRRWLRALKQHNFIVESADGFKAIRNITEEELSSHWKNCQTLVSELGDQGGLLTYLSRSSTCLPQLLQGTVDPLQLLFPDGQLEVATQTYQNNLISRFMNQILLYAALEKTHFVNKVQKRTVKVLEIGAGVGGTSNVLIPLLAKQQVTYTFTDISPFFLNEAKERYSAYDIVEYRLFDFNQSLVAQGFNYGQYDLVISSNVLHNAIVAREGLTNLKQLLAPGGWLLIIEATRDNYQLMTSMEFKHGLTNFKDERLALDSPFMPQQNWLNALEDVGAEYCWAYPKPDDALSKMGQSFILAQFNTNRLYCDPQVITAKLQKRLPEYMLPNRLAVLDQLALSTDKRIDRKQLPPLFSDKQPDSNDSDSDNLDALQQQLLELCRQVLGHPNIGLNDDFFVHGGDSLLVTQWVNRIRDTLGVDKIPWDDCLKLIFQQPTVYALADFLRRHWQSSAESGPISHQPEMSCLKKGIKPPIILFHEGSGTLMPYRNLLEQLTDSVYGFNITNDETFLSLPTNNLINALALRYLPQLETIQQPIHLVGYCMGGLIAYEAARQLMEKGHAVESLTIVSSYQIPYRIEDPLMVDFVIAQALGLTEMWGFNQTDIGVLYQDILLTQPSVITEKDVINIAAKKGFKSLINRYQNHQLLTDEQRLDCLLDALERCHTLPLQQTRQQWKKLCRIFRHSILGMCQYQPGYFAGDITFCCQQGNTYLLPTLQRDMTEFWQQYCLGTVQVLLLSGDHFSCLSKDNVKPLVEHLETTRGT